MHPTPLSKRDDRAGVSYSRWIRLARWTTFVCLTVRLDAYAQGAVMPKAELIGLEATQGVQDWAGSVPLVEGKLTLVRATLRAQGNQAIPVLDARLHASHGGVPLAGSPLSPINPGGRVIAQPAAEFRRDSSESSANFLMPLEWASSVVDLRFEGSDVLCRESAGAPWNCAMHAFFTAGTPLDVKYVNVAWTGPDGREHLANDAEILREADKVTASFPIPAPAQHTVGFVRLNAANGPDLWRILSDLEAVRLQDGCAGRCEPIYFGLIKHLPASQWLLDEDSSLLTRTAATGVPSNSSVHFDYQLVSHRLAHLLGVSHAVHSSLPRSAQQEKTGWCNERAPASAPDFPDFAEVDGSVHPTLGPMQAGEEQLIFGIEAFPRPPIPLGNAWEARNGPRIISPYATFDLMSHCGWMDGQPDRLTWPSKFTYTSLFQAIRTRATLGTASAAQDYWIVSGLIRWREQTGQLELLGSGKGPLPGPVAGDYAIEMRNTDGVLLRTMPFQPIGLVGVPGPDTPDAVTFSVAIPPDPAAREIRLTHGAAPLAVRKASSQPPLVEVVFPNGGELLASDPAVIRWQGSDPDGDALAYGVQYSADGGASWETIGWRLSDTQCALSPTHLRSTTNGLVRILASDGFVVTSAVSKQPFQVPDHSPTLAILSPGTNQVVAGSESVVFAAQVHDPDGQLIPDSKLEWHSNVDGFIGAGRILQKSASTLTPGPQLMTLRVTEAGGGTTTAQVSVTVARKVPDNSGDLTIAATAISGKELLLSWPMARTGAVLQRTESLLPPIAWLDASLPLTTNETAVSVVVPLMGRGQFYRLAQP